MPLKKKRTINRSVFLYLATILIISGWWAIAFRSPLPSKFVVKKDLITANPSDSLPLSDFDRGRLKKSLGGDFALMGQLMAEWDVDAQLLSGQRLPPDRFQRGQILSRLLKNRSRDVPPKKFLPQTYVAASILLAIAHPEQLVALPKGLRQSSELFSKEVTDLIPFDIDRFNSEKLYLAKPDFAFVSSRYSHPAAIEALRNQGIALVMLGSLDRMADIQESIVKIGQVTDRSQEAEALNLFIDAALLAIGNRARSISPAKTLYLSYYTQLMTPSKQTFTYEWLQKLGLETEHFDGLKESMMVDQEKLFALNPERLLISTSNPAALRAKMERDPAYQGLRAIQTRQFFFLDDDTQQAACQMAVLAYFDIVQALLEGATHD